MLVDAHARARHHGALGLRQLVAVVADVSEAVLHFILAAVGGNAWGRRGDGG